MAKAKSKKGGGHAFQPRKKQNPFQAHRRHRNHRNPAFAGFANLTDLFITMVSAAIGGIADAYIPQLVLGDKNTGLFGYIGEIVVAVVPAWLLASYPNAAKGWLIGGGVNIVGHVVDDATGQEYIVFKGPASGVGAFYAPNQPYPIPAASIFGQFASAQRGQRMLNPGTAANSPLSIAAAGAPVSGGMAAVRYPFAA